MWPCVSLVPSGGTAPAVRRRQRRRNGKREHCSNGQKTHCLPSQCLSIVTQRQSVAVDRPQNVLLNENSHGSRGRCTAEGRHFL
jgi:hypothetical protein